MLAWGVRNSAAKASASFTVKHKVAQLMGSREPVPVDVVGPVGRQNDERPRSPG